MLTVSRLALAVVAAIAVQAAPAAAAPAPSMKIDPTLQVTTACFPVTDPLGLPRTLYGTRARLRRLRRLLLRPARLRAQLILRHAGRRRDAHHARAPADAPPGRA